MYEHIYTCGLLKAQNAASDLQVDLKMLGRTISTNIAYKEQKEHILKAGKEELIIIFSYTGSYFEYEKLRSKEKHLLLPRIWMICGTDKQLPWYVNESIRFHSDQSQLSHPFTLEAIESLIVQEYARLLKITE